MSSSRKSDTSVDSIVASIVAPVDVNSTNDSYSTVKEAYGKLYVEGKQKLDKLIGHKNMYMFLPTRSQLNILLKFVIDPYNMLRSEIMDKYSALYIEKCYASFRTPFTNCNPQSCFIEGLPTYVGEYYFWSDNYPYKTELYKASINGSEVQTLDAKILQGSGITIKTRGYDIEYSKNFNLKNTGDISGEDYCMIIKKLSDGTCETTYQNYFTANNLKDNSAFNVNISTLNFAMLSYTNKNGNIPNLPDKDIEGKDTYDERHSLVLINAYDFVNEYWKYKSQGNDYKKEGNLYVVQESGCAVKFMYHGKYEIDTIQVFESTTVNFLGKLTTN